MDFDVLGLAKQLFDAVMHGQWALVAALALAAAVFALRKLGSKVPFLASDAGGVLLTFFGALAGGLANSFAAGEGFSLALLFKSAQVAFLAMGGYAALKKLFAPLLDRAWSWLKGKLGLEAA